MGKSALTYRGSFFTKHQLYIYGLALTIHLEGDCVANLMLIFYLVEVVYSFYLVALTLGDDISYFDACHICRGIGCHAGYIHTDLEVVSLGITLGYGTSANAYHRTALYIAICNEVFDDGFCIVDGNGKAYALIL